MAVNATGNILPMVNKTCINLRKKSIEVVFYHVYAQ